jgi:hypothetical protein
MRRNGGEKANHLGTVLQGWDTIYFYQIFFIYQLMHKRIALKITLKFTLKQLQHVSGQSPSSGSVLFELAKVTVVKMTN